MTLGLIVLFVMATIFLILGILSITKRVNVTRRIYRHIFSDNDKLMFIMPGIQFILLSIIIYLVGAIIIVLYIYGPGLLDYMYLLLIPTLAYVIYYIYYYVQVKKAEEEYLYYHN